MKKRLKKILRIFIYVHVFLAVALLLTHCSFSYYAKKSYEQAKKDKPFDVVIVPGVPYEKENTTSIMRMRVYWAKHLYDSGFTKNIIFSGSAVYTHFVEGIVMKTMADSLGIPPEHTFAETTAEHSTENIYYSWKMAKKMGFQKIALATDPFQSRVLQLFSKKYCPGVTAVPVVYDILDRVVKPLPLIDTTGAYRGEFISIVEREKFWRRFQGTLGRRVKEEIRMEAEFEKEAKKKPVTTNE
jgi:uncharacterized SAM-binding protein YcdF (DUF218 family)